MYPHLFPHFPAACETLQQGTSFSLTHLPQGWDACIAAGFIQELAKKPLHLPVIFVHVAADGQRSRAFQEAIAFAAPHVEILDLPAWDCQPYDRSSPSQHICAKRALIFSRLARSFSSPEHPRILCLTVNSLLQRVLPRTYLEQESFSAASGNAVKTEDLALWLETHGFSRTHLVQDVGDFAVRGGLVDLYPPGYALPLRLDFFGTTLESIRTFDPQTQRTIGYLRSLDLVPIAEVQLKSDTIRHFRQSYLSEFGGQTQDDPLYHTISQGRPYPGMEHWMPLFYKKLETIFDYIGSAPLWLDPLANASAQERLSQIQDYYEARQEEYARDMAKSHYKPLAPERLFLTPSEWAQHVHSTLCIHTHPQEHAQTPTIFSCHGQIGRSFATEREAGHENIFEVAVAHLQACQAKGRRVILCAMSDGSRERLHSVLADHGLKKTDMISTLDQALSLPQDRVALCVLGLERGFETDTLTFLSETDLLGDRWIRHRHRSKHQPHLFLTQAASLQAGDLVVHVDHGIGRFVGLQTITALNVPHDCVEIHYAGGDKLYLPVENIELISRYGSEDTEVPLDKLGGHGWHTRKHKMKIRVQNIAAQLVKIAAERQLRPAPVLTPPVPAFEEFCARFRYDETEDQQAAIDATLTDLSLGKPMDRLICGDVGFGKTEIALRAAFVAAMAGKQVALIVPTTLLARQHYAHFRDRFSGFPVEIAQLSRIVPASEQKRIKEKLQKGTLDIIIGTHALLGKSITFKDLALVIVDEEQHFGVAHKERLKDLRKEVHVLTLSATPIPRTLQLAMTGVRDLSIIATPPTDRLAVRSTFAPFDPLMVREALLREHYRGGQSFYVCPRLEDLPDASAFLRKHVPEVRFIIAHGQMPAQELEEKISTFYDGACEVLLSTSIVESGLDIPRANTLIVHRADRFGLGQLYQLRGRVGRAKARAYALFTIPATRTITSQAQKRLEILQSLDKLGAGFQLATHDLDLRGAGNLLGEEQSGHIKEVGYELYQRMIQEAVAAIQEGVSEPMEDMWSPTLSLGMPVTLPEHYISDLTLRLQFYRRLSTIETEEEIDAMAAEMTDRFGPIPEEGRYVLQLMAIKVLCRQAHIEKVDAGPKGVTIAFKDHIFANPAGLLRLVSDPNVGVKLRQDMSLFFTRAFENPNKRMEGTKQILKSLVTLAKRGEGK